MYYECICSVFAGRLNRTVYLLKIIYCLYIDFETSQNVFNNDVSIHVYVFKKPELLETNKILSPGNEIRD